jgi:hypothetical protein
MLTALSTGASFRLAIAFTLFAALSFVAPPAVLAFGHGENTAHCLSMAVSANHGMAKPADTAHHDAAHHGHHAVPDEDRTAPTSDQSMTCCGLFCLSAVACDSGEAMGTATHDVHVLAHEPHRLARGPGRIDRPPIPLPFV